MIKKGGVRLNLLGCTYIMIGIIWISAIPYHAFYVSIMEVEWDEDTASGILLFKIFTNDLEDAIYYQQKRRISINQSLGSRETIEMISGYLHNKVSIKFDGKPLDWNYVQGESLQDAVWLKYGYKTTENPAEISIKNSILLELFDTQTNIVRFNVSGERKMLKLDKNNSEGIQRF